MLFILVPQSLHNHGRQLHYILQGFELRRVKILKTFQPHFDEPILNELDLKVKLLRGAPGELAEEIMFETILTISLIKKGVFLMTTLASGK